MSLDVFISYSTKDKLTADAVCGTLESRGIRCWIAPRDITPGQDWSDAIIDGLTGARAFVLLLSSSSNISEQVKREVQNAVSEGLPIVPFRLEDVALSKHMRYFIGTPHWLDALTPPLEAHLDRLAKTIAALLQTTDKDHADSVLLLEEGLSDPVPPLGPLGKEEWSPDVLRRIERELALYLGPMARMMVHQGAMKTSDPNALCQIVSRSIPRDDERARFLQTTAQLFGSVPVSPPLAATLSVLAAPTWEPALLQKIERQFAVHMGPLSRILVKRASQKVTSVDELYQLLAQNLATPREREAFLTEKRA